MGKNILTATIEIKGIRPLLWHVFGPDSLPLEKQEKTGVAGHNPDEWKKTFTATKEGQLYLPGSYFFGTYIAGAKFTKKGKGSIQSMVSATLQVLDDKVLVNRRLPSDIYEVPQKYYNADDELVYIDVRSVRNPSTKARNIRYRIATCPGWECKFSVIFDKTVVSRAEMQAAIIDAGKLCGIGDGRSVGYGRFEVVSFEVTEDAEKATS